MAAAPKYKVFNPVGQYVAACKLPEDAAAIVASYGDGAEIRVGHSVRDVVWREGQHDVSAGESYDYVALVVHANEDALPVTRNRPRKRRRRKGD